MTALQNHFASHEAFLTKRELFCRLHIALWLGGSCLLSSHTNRSNTNQPGMRKGAVVLSSEGVVPPRDVCAAPEDAAWLVTPISEEAYDRLHPPHLVI